MSSLTDPKVITIIIIFLVIVILIAYSYGANCSVNSIENQERFGVNKADCSDAKCQDTSLLEIGNNLLLPPTHYISTDNFNKMVIDLRALIITTLRDQARMCSGMNGDDGLEKTHLTFNCINDIEGVQDIVTNRIATYIIEYAKYVYNINMNPQLIISDFTNNLDLLESVIYPLLYSRRYDVHGINYFTNEMLVDKVVNGIKIQNVLISTLQRRGIELLPLTDNHI